MTSITSSTLTFRSSEGRKFPEPLALRIIDDARDLCEIAACWDSLVAGRGAPFQGYAWNRAWYDAFSGEIDEVLVFLFLDRESIQGILPAYRSGRCLRLAGDTVGDFQDLIAPDSWRVEEMLGMVFDHVRENGWEIHFEKLAETGMIWRSLEAAAERKGFCHHTRPYGPCPWFELPESPDAWLKTLSRSRRKGVKNNANRLKRMIPGAAFRVLTGEEIGPDEIDLIAGLHSRNQYRKSGDSIFDREEFRNFLEMTAGDPETGLILLLLETSGGEEVIAMDLGMIRGGRYFSYIGTYEQKYADCGPGICQLYQLVQILIERGVRVFDFLCGAEHYKFIYAKYFYRTHSSVLFPATPVNRLRLRGRCWARQLRLLIKALLVRWKLYDPPFRLDMGSLEKRSPSVRGRG